MIAAAREKLGESGIDYRVLDILDFPDLGTFDVVFSTFWVSHVPLEFHDEFWAWVVRSLEIGGQVIFQDSVAQGLGGGGDCRRAPDRHRHRGHDHRSESRPPAKAAQCEANVLPHPEPSHGTPPPIQRSISSHGADPLWYQIPREIPDLSSRDCDERAQPPCDGSFQSRAELQPQREAGVLSEIARETP